jgi:hypothetical protein
MPRGRLRAGIHRAGEIDPNWKTALATQKHWRSTKDRMGNLLLSVVLPKQEVGVAIFLCQPMAFAAR